MTRKISALFAMGLACGTAFALFARSSPALVPQTAPASPGGEMASLQVSADGRHFLNDDGTPFFWLGDTGWLLFQATTREEADLYLQTRAQQGFTVIQAAVVMGEERVAGTLQPNAYGDQAFLAGNPASPIVTPGNNPARSDQYDYWDHVDFIVERARAHQIRLGLLPLFVGYEGPGYRYLTPDRSAAYGAFLGRRYGSASHVFWILGGDHTPGTDEQRATWHELARALTMAVAGTEDYSRTLMTYHVNGQFSSSRWFHHAPWLDFNMVQIWGVETGIYPAVFADYRLDPVKPTGLGEGSYEDGPQYPSRPIDALKVRQQAYWSYFAGGYHTYGNTNTWNFGTFRQEATEDWRVALDSAGAKQLSVLAQVFASLPWWTLVPDASIVSGGASDGIQVVALRSGADRLILVYASSPVTFTVTADAAAGQPMLAWWIDPRTGERALIGRIGRPGPYGFSTPGGWRDALLLIEPEGGAGRSAQTIRLPRLLS
jgi:hypothetical protein